MHFPRSFAAACCAAVFASLSMVPAGAQTVWTSTATKGISVSELVSAADYGPLPSSQPITVRVVLKLQNQSSLNTYIKNINNPNSALYGQSLTPAQFATAYAPSSTQVQQAVSYLQSKGFTNVVVEPNHLLISADGTVAQAETAFNTHIEQFAEFGKIVYGNTTVAQVPVSLSGTVAAVLGLNTIGQMKPTLVTRAQVSGVPQYDVSYTPRQMQLAYNANTIPTGINATIAIMAEGNVSGVLTDLRAEEAANKMPQVPVTVIKVGVASPDTSGWDEWDLDTQYSTGMAQTVKRLYIYDTTSLTDSDLALEISRWATDDKAKGGSASLGECEVFPFLDGSMLADDESFAEGAAQGQSFFASTGDTGTFCPVGVGTNGVPAGVPMVNYPAASQYVMGVGGTTLLTNSNGTWDSEVTWYAGGGGISQFEYSPWWQTAAAVPSSTAGDKGIPDIAMDADPYSGANIYYDGSWLAVGGTSLSSPLALGMWARLISANPKLGFAPIRYYGLYDGATTPGSYPKGGFHDIIVGANGYFTALPGWDYTTGLGSLWGSQLYTDIK